MFAAHKYIGFTRKPEGLGLLLERHGYVITEGADGKPCGYKHAALNEPIILFNPQLPKLEQEGDVPWKMSGRDITCFVDVCYIVDELAVEEAWKISSCMARALDGVLYDEAFETFYTRAQLRKQRRQEQ